VTSANTHLRVFKRVAVDLTGRCEQNARLIASGQSEHIQRAHNVGLDGEHGVLLVVDG
jgi:hypothetical protein